jgi:hypothetical protein
LNPTPAEKDLLAAIAGFRLATASQLAIQSSASEQLVRRRCRALTKLGLIRAASRSFGRRGRPESRFSLTADGVAFLQANGSIEPDVPCDRVTSDRIASNSDHQIALNWVAIECERLCRSDQRFDITFIASTSPHHLSRSGGTMLFDHAVAADGQEFSFTPDAAFTVTRRSDGKNLLFLAEVDMGTEPLTARKRNRDACLQRKVEIYRTYLARKGYQRYERDALFGKPFRGFRLLIITNTSERANQLCNLLQRMSPVSFAWVTTLASLEEVGLGGEIWASGGILKARRSILGGEYQQPGKKLLS